MLVSRLPTAKRSFWSSEGKILFSRGSGAAVSMLFQENQKSGVCGTTSMECAAKI